MAVKLETNIKRFIGLSTDAKPLPIVDSDLPVGSSFLENDTGTIYRWDGQMWLCPPAADQQLAVLQIILVEITQLRELVEIATS